jgi:hypothetical protein
VPSKQLDWMQMRWTVAGAYFADAGQEAGLLTGDLVVLLPYTSVFRR